jgi:GntR family transcriptional regulator of abcA and norABC
MRGLPLAKVKYKQIIDYIKKQIANGEWPIGSKLPSQRELAKMFDVNRSTVITALEELIADGLIEGIMGKGTIVINNTWTLMKQESPANWSENIQFGNHLASMSTVQTINLEESNSELIQFSKGELSPHMFPLKEMQAIIEKVSNELSPFGYEEPKGNRKLREAISLFLKEKGIYASPASILIVSGALQALQLISIGLLQRGSAVFLDQPSYLYSLSTFQSAGMHLSGIPMDNDGILVNKLKLKKIQKERAILYTIPSFHNPTGILMTADRRKELLQTAKDLQLPIIEDDVYGDLWLDTSPPPSLKAQDKFGNVLYVGSLSKSLTPGLRIGWVVGPQPVIERLADLKMQTDYGSSALSQRVAAEWFRSGLYKEHLKRIREQLRLRKIAALDALTIYMKNLASWEEPKGGFFIWLQIHPEFAIRDLHVKVLAKGFLLNPGSIYAQQNRQCFRLSYAYASIEDIVKGIKMISEIIKTNYNSKEK